MLNVLPPDVLEHIAYYASTDTMLGPPSGLVPLLSLCRSTSAILRRSTNPHLYARIFAAKFDVAAPRRRFAQLYGADSRSVLPVNALADELVRRFTVLKRINSEPDARSFDQADETMADDSIATSEASASLDEILWTAFLMVLEDEGRNTTHLRNARMGAWLAVYWFDAHGASGAIRRLAADRWPVVPGYSSGIRQGTRHALGMWLLWFFLDPAAYVANSDLYRRAERILKLVALNAPLYPLSNLPWTSFQPEPTQIHFGLPSVPSTEPFDPRTDSSLPLHESTIDIPESFTYFGRHLPQLTPLPPAVPANLALLALHARSRRNADTLEGGLELLELLGPSLTELFIALPEQKTAVDRLPPNDREERPEGELDISSLNGRPKREELPTETDSYRWEYEWLRCVSSNVVSGLTAEMDSDISNNHPVTRKYKTYQPGCLEGSWEGPFTYTEFHSFAALLAGAWPSKLQDCLIAQHNQTWCLREYHLLAPSRLSSTQTNGMRKELVPLPVGDPILAHMPEGIAIEDDGSSLRVTLPSSFTLPPTTSSSGNAAPLPIVYHYTRYCWSSSAGVDEGAMGDHDGLVGEDWKAYASRVADILLSGEGHSGFGEFRLLGRIRPIDGFITIMKEYTGGDRGRWLYRGYLVGGGAAPCESNRDSDEEDEGGGKGYIVGRWRDMLTPAETHGYEGAFAMARRR